MKRIQLKTRSNTTREQVQGICADLEKVEQALLVVANHRELLSPSIDALIELRMQIHLAKDDLLHRSRSTAPAH